MSGSLDIVALGARTPVGLVAQTSAAAVRAGITRIGEYPFIAEDGELVRVAFAPYLDTAIEAADRLQQLAHGTIIEVIRDLGDAARHVHLLFLVVLPELRPGIVERDQEAVMARLRALTSGLNLRISFAYAGQGHAGVGQAIQHAFQRPGYEDDTLPIILGADSYLHPKTLIWLETKRLFGPQARNGFIPGEGAGCVALAPPHLRRRLGLPCLAQIRGLGLAQEHLLADSDAGSFGEGMTKALRGALADLQLPRDAVDDIYTDINGERYRSEEWGFVALHLHAAFRALEYHAPSDCWGDVGAASGALGIVLAVRAWARGYSRGPRALILNGSYDGLRSAILLQDPTLP